jgi:hypothetical protein
MLKWLLLGLLLLCVEITLVVILVTDQAVQAAITTEHALAADWLGDRVAAQVEEQASRDFNRRFVHTGVVAASYAILLPDEEVRRRSNVLADMGSKDVFPYLEGRLQVWWDTVRQVYWRLALAQWWLWYLALPAFAALLDGLLRRRVKLAEFGNCSPAVHRYSLYGLLALLYLFILSLLAPWPLSPFIMPVLMGLAILCVNGLLANTPARV